MAMADGPLQVAVAGGSIGGLCAGLALQRIAGAEVDIYERHVGEVETRGAGIVVQPELTQLLRLVDAAELPTTGCRVRRYLEPDGGEGSEQVMPQRFTSWEAIFQTLRGAFPDGRYHVGAALGAFDTVDGRIKAEIAGRGLITADLLVCADGAQSPTRRRLLPDATSDYAGYVAWRGTLDEAVAPAELARFFDDTFTFSEARSGGHILVYYIPGASADSTRGKRRLNWVWYVGADDAVGGTENFTILATVRGSIPNCRAASRWLSPSIWTA
jgi:2-polyprenyl-6-methoxyphenol hydroxylase-like FAD-dependent oxidoreductase